MGLNANVTMQNGVVAASNVNTGGSFYMDPGNALTLALQSNTGVQQWVVTVLSDYGPLNGWTYSSSQLFSGVAIPMPQAPCKLTVSSECTDGNNLTQATFFVYNYPRYTVPDRAVRFIVTANQNLTSFNTNATYDGVTPVAGDRCLLVGQATLAQNGPYVVGTPASNSATLARPGDFVTGQVVVSPPTFEVAEGTTFSGSTWKDLTASNGTATVDTTNVNYYPRILKFTLSNIANSTTATANSFIATGATAVCISSTSANACKVANINVSAGSGNITATCVNANDAGWLTCFNW